MTDVRLTATNPDDSSVVPVACNAKGELLLAEDSVGGGDHVKLDDGGTKQVIESAGLGISDGTTENITLDADGSATFAGDVSLNHPSGEYTILGTRGRLSLNRDDTTPALEIYDNSGSLLTDTGNVKLYPNGSAKFASTVQCYADAADPLDHAFRVSNSVNNVAGFAVLGDGGLLIGGPVDSQNPNTKINADGSATFAGDVVSNTRLKAYGGVGNNGGTDISSGKITVRQDGSGNDVFTILRATETPVVLKSDGSATFNGDVVIGSRGQQWMIVESGGIAHLVAQTFKESPEGKAEYPELRNIPQELTMVEQQLQKVMERLRMVPEAGWEVWDGSD